MGPPLRFFSGVWAGRSAQDSLVFVPPVYPGEAGMTLSAFD